MNIEDILNDNNIEYEIIDDKIYLENIILNLSEKNLKGILDVSKIENLEKLYCYRNNITEIILNEKLVYLGCGKNLLKEIICNKNLESLYCYENNLTKIVCNDNLVVLHCGYNKLTKIICNVNLQILYCHSNPILSLNRNNFKYFNSDICIYNNEYYFRGNKIEKLKDFYFFKRFRKSKCILYTYQNRIVDEFYNKLNGKYN